MDNYQQSQKNKLFKPEHGDPYLEPTPQGTAHCPQCGALHHQGRWSWQQVVPDEVQQHLCPACRRIADDQPAGTLHLSGGFLARHREEILGLIHNTEAAEKSQHALERLLRITDQDDGLLVTTTGMHLAQRIGHALSAAYKGEWRLSLCPGRIPPRRTLVARLIEASSWGLDRGRRRALPCAPQWAGSGRSSHEHPSPLG